MYQAAYQAQSDIYNNFSLEMLQNDLEGIGIHALMRANYTSNDTNGVQKYLNESGKFDHGKLT